LRACLPSRSAGVGSRSPSFTSATLACSVRRIIHLVPTRLGFASRINPTFWTGQGRQRRKVWPSGSAPPPGGFERPLKCKTPAWQRAKWASSLVAGPGFEPGTFGCATRRSAEKLADPGLQRVHQRRRGDPDNLLGRAEVPVRQDVPHAAHVAPRDLRRPCCDPVRDTFAASSMISMFRITASRVRSSAMKASKVIPDTYLRTLHTPR
jgi:hypothetical protein